jgi:hypothetical protein
MTKLKSLSNIQLEELIKKFNLPLNDIIMRDEADKINEDGFYIINLDTSKGNGSHWTSLYYHPLQSYYFDSFGFVPPFDVEDVIIPYIHNNKDIQDYDSDACGWYCIAFIKFLNDKQNKELGFKEFLRLFSNKTTENDNILKEYLACEV